MNLTNKTKGDILFLNFNQDYSCLSVGTKEGFKIYNCEPFGKCYGKEEGSIGIAEMLFCTSLVAIVGAGLHSNQSPRTLRLFNTKRQTVICELSFESTILAVKMNKKRMVVLLENKIHIYDIKTLKCLYEIERANPKGLIALSPSLEKPYLIYPTDIDAGKLYIFDVEALRDVTVADAHKTAVTAISINTEGTLLATASERGTVIRVFSVPDATNLFQYRRGTYPTTIYSMAFSPQSTMLCVSSESETVHIFKLENTNRPKQLVSVTSFLPDVFSQWDLARDFAHLKLTTPGLHNICAFSQSTPMVMVATAEGYFYHYKIDTTNGGECQLHLQHSLLDSAEEKI